MGRAGHTFHGELYSDVSIQFLERRPSDHGTDCQRMDGSSRGRWISNDMGSKDVLYLPRRSLRHDCRRLGNFILHDGLDRAFDFIKQKF